MIFFCKKFRFGWQSILFRNTFRIYNFKCLSAWIFCNGSKFQMEMLGVPRPKSGRLEIETRDVQAERTGRRVCAMGKLDLKMENYCWWKKSCTSWYGKYPIIYWVLYIPGGAGFLPSTVWKFVVFYFRRAVAGWLPVPDSFSMLKGDEGRTRETSGASCGKMLQVWDQDQP